MIPPALPRRSHRHQGGMVHLTFIMVVLVVVVVIVLNRQIIQQEIGTWSNKVISRLSLTAGHIGSRIVGTLDNVMHGNLSLDSGGITVSPGALDDLFTEQLDLATMARALPRLETRAPLTKTSVPRGVAPICSPLLNPVGLDLATLQALKAACTQAAPYPANPPCGNGLLCTPIKTQ